MRIGARSTDGRVARDFSVIPPLTEVLTVSAMFAAVMMLFVR